MGSSRLSADRTLGRLARAPLGLIPAGTTVRVVRGPLRGRRWIVGSGTHGMWLGTYETHLMDLFRQMVRPGDVVYDLGAHVGAYTILASKLAGPRGRVVAFEPLPRNVGYLRRHLSLNGIDNATVVAAAVGERSGTARFDPGPHPSMGRSTSTGTIEVPMATLDDLVGEGTILAPDVMKVDVEGGELAALRGAKDVLGHHPTILLSLHGEEIREGCLALLGDAGYDVRSIRGNPYEVAARPRPPRAG